MRKMVYLVLSIALLAAGCTPARGENPDTPDDALHIVASTSIVADVVRQVSGEDAVVDVLIPAGNDPHSYAPTPQDVARIARADVIFLNGLGLEAGVQPVLENARPDAAVVELSQGIDLLEKPVSPSGEEGEGNHAEGADPHLWSDPNNVRVWLSTIADTLAARDPSHAEAYRRRAESYQKTLEELDAWVKEQVASIPPERRVIVSDHLMWGYFCARYNFRQQGALIPGYSTLAQPSAQELAALEDAIRQMGVPAIFVGNTVNPSLAERVAADTGVKLVTVYTGSLSEPDGPAPTYVDWVRYNVTAIVDALQ